MKATVPYMKAIWAESANGVIGSQGGLPWKSSEDMKIFREKTAGSTIIMGRKTWDSLPVKPLPGRENIIVTRDFFNVNPPDVHSFSSAQLDRAFFDDHPKGIHQSLMARSIENRRPIWVIGGSQIFREFWPYLAELHITIFPDLIVNGDTSSPLLERVDELPNHWEMKESECRFIQTETESLDHLVFVRK